MCRTSGEPTRWISRFSITRKSFACIGSEVSPTSSRNTVPPFANSKSPGRVSVAPVNAPRYVPEELALQQRVHHCGTVTHRQLLLAHRTDLVDGPGDQLFSRSRRPHQQN